MSEKKKEKIEKNKKTVFFLDGTYIYKEEGEKTQREETWPRRQDS